MAQVDTKEMQGDLQDELQDEINQLEAKKKELEGFISTVTDFPKKVGTPVYLCMNVLKYNLT